MMGPDTELCFSLSERPGSVGVFIQNTLSSRFCLDRVYLPRRVKRDALRDAVAGIRALGVSGFAVSSPFKEEVIAHIDHVTSVAADIRSVNTVINDDEMLVGFSTDVGGFKLAYGETLAFEHVTAAVVLGAGPAARAVSRAVQEMGLSLRIYSRESKNFGVAWSVFPGCVASMSELSSHVGNAATVLVNATSARDETFGLTAEELSRYAAVIDINTGGSALLSAVDMSAERVPVVYDGLRMAVAQSLLQFELWTDVRLDDYERELVDAVVMMNESTETL